MVLNYISKSVIYIPFLISQRWKVRILPKHYDDSTTPFMEGQKPGKSPFTNVIIALHKNRTLADFWKWMKQREVENMISDQRYMPERHKCLGPDLATTHFIIARGGKVKFFGKHTWMTKNHIENGQIPSTYTPGFYVEELDASGFNLIYEGFDNLCNLTKLRKLYLRNCPLLDDWCLSRFHLFENTLEYLDISGCHLVTERGICTLHLLRKLKTLVIRDTPNIQNKELVCLLLQDIVPECEIIGVNYNDPVLLKKLEKYIE